MFTVMVFNGYGWISLLIVRDACNLLGSGGMYYPRDDRYPMKGKFINLRDVASCEVPTSITPPPSY